MTQSDIAGTPRSANTLLRNVAVALGFYVGPTPAQRLQSIISNPNDISVDYDRCMLRIGKAEAPIPKLSGVRMSPPAKTVGIVDVSFSEGNRQEGKKSRYAGTFKINSPAFTKLRKVLKAHRLG